MKRFTSMRGSFICERSFVDTRDAHKFLLKETKWKYKKTVTFIFVYIGKFYIVLFFLLFQGHTRNKQSQSIYKQKLSFYLVDNFHFILFLKTIQMCLQFTEEKKKQAKSINVGSKGLESYYIMYSSRICALKSHLLSNNIDKEKMINKRTTTTTKEKWKSSWKKLVYHPAFVFMYDNLLSFLLENKRQTN